MYRYLHLSITALFSCCFNQKYFLDGKLQGFGIVQFKQVEDASKAMAEMNAKPILSMLHLYLHVVQ